MAFGQTAIHAPRKGLIAQWWHEWKSNRDSFAALDRCGHSEVERIAHDLSLTAAELRTLAHKGVDSALLLCRRMADLDLDRAEVGHAQPKVMRDLQKLCTICDSKTRCGRDFDRDADPSAWHAYCPNDDTLQALTSQAVKASNRVGALPSAVNFRRGQAHATAWLWSLLLIGWVWLVFDTNSQITDFHFPSGSLPNSTTAAVDALSAPAINCLDASCLNAQQRTALQTVRSVQKQGWINTSIDQKQALQQASLDAQDVHNGEALVCSSGGGTTYYGLMFHQGCSQGGVEGTKLNGYNTCQPMTGGGVCFVK
jgi:hypothetical protein